MTVNKKIQKNLVMIGSLSAAGLVALGLFVYLLILVFDWAEYSERTAKARDEVIALRKRTPAPGKENEERIQKDIAFFEEKSTRMVNSFKSPLRPAVDEFLKLLPPPLLKELSEEEKEYYKKPGTGIEGDEETKAVPLAIRKLSYDDFRKFFMERFEKFCQERNYTEDKDRFSLTTLSLFRSECVSLFPAGSWKRALDAFVKTVKPLTNETVNEADPLPLLLVGFGMPRRVAANPELLARQVDEIIERKIIPTAEKSKLELEEGSLKFIGGSTETKGLAVKDYPMAFFHWDVFGDIVNRLGKGGATALRQVILRTQAAEEGGEDMMGGGSTQSGGLNLEASFEQDGNYRLYHYTIVFRGNMQAVRKVMRAFDTAWMENRMYLVRGVALYAGENHAAEIMKQKTIETRENQSVATREDNDRPRRRRRRQAEEEPARDVADNQEGQPKAEYTEEALREGHYRVLIKRKLKAAEESEDKKGAEIDERLNEYLHVRPSSDAGSHSKEEKDEFFAEFAKSLPANERFGYGKVLIGTEKKDDCLIYLDIDYVVLEQQSE